jgi:hypothetical protein
MDEVHKPITTQNRVCYQLSVKHAVQLVSDLSLPSAENIRLLIHSKIRDPTQAEPHTLAGQVLYLH